MLNLIQVLTKVLPFAKKTVDDFKQKKQREKAVKTSLIKGLFYLIWQRFKGVYKEVATIAIFFLILIKLIFAPQWLAWMDLDMIYSLIEVIKEDGQSVIVIDSIGISEPIFE